MSEFCFFGNSKFSSHKIRGGEFSKFFSEQIWQTLHLFAVIHLYHIFTIVGGCQVKTLIIEMLSFWSTIAPRPLSTGLVFRTDVALLIACEGEVWLPPEIGLVISFLPFLKRESRVLCPAPLGRVLSSQSPEGPLSCQLWRTMLGKKKSRSLGLSETASRANSVEQEAKTSISYSWVK